MTNLPSTFPASSDAVENAKTRFMKFINDPKSIDSCWEWGGFIKETGYGQFRLNRDKMITAHRASFMIFNNEIPEGLCVLHKCDNRKCVNPSHLFLGTNQDNVDDREKKGRNNSPFKIGVNAVSEKSRARGVRVKNSKLNEDTVREMRLIRLTSKPSFKELGLIFGVSSDAARCAVTQKTWAHVS